MSGLPVPIVSPAAAVNGIAGEAKPLKPEGLADRFQALMSAAAPQFAAISARLTTALPAPLKDKPETSSAKDNIPAHAAHGPANDRRQGGEFQNPAKKEIPTRRDEGVAARKLVPEKRASVERDDDADVPRSQFEEAPALTPQDAPLRAQNIPNALSTDEVDSMRRLIPDASEDAYDRLAVMQQFLVAALQVFQTPPAAAPPLPGAAATADTDARAVAPDAVLALSAAPLDTAADAPAPEEGGASLMGGLPGFSSVLDEMWQRFQATQELAGAPDDALVSWPAVMSRVDALARAVRWNGGSAEQADGAQSGTIGLQDVSPQDMAAAKDMLRQLIEINKAIMSGMSGAAQDSRYPGLTEPAAGGVSGAAGAALRPAERAPAVDALPVSAAVSPSPRGDLLSYQAAASASVLLAQPSSDFSGGEQAFSDDSPAPAIIPPGAAQAKAGIDGAHSSFARVLGEVAPRGAGAAEQVAFHVKTALKDGSSRIEIVLDPPHLGKLEITLDVASDGKAGVSILADSKQTLDMLQKDAQNLQRALADAGLKADGGALSFNLRGQQQDSQGQHAAQTYRKHKPQADEEQVLEVVRSYTMSISDGLDIRI